MKKLINGLLLFICTFTFADETPYIVEAVAENLDHPWSIAFLPDNTYLISLPSGSLHRLSEDGVLGPGISGLPNTYSQGQGGFFDVVLDPNFTNNQRIYLSRAAGTAKSNTTEVISGRLLNNTLLAVKTVFSIHPTKDTALHYGGRLAFLNDGTLLLTSGEAYKYRTAAQNPFSQLGKVVRFNSDGSVPSDNPHADGKKADPYIFTLGHRNPQGLFIDPSNETIYLHEHGAKGGDEVNILKAGENYGWPATTHGVNYSGTIISRFESLPDKEDPIHVWVPSIAPSGLTLYRGIQFPNWDNSLFIGALASREVRRLQLENGKIISEEALFTEIKERIRDIRTGPDGYLYILTDSPQGKVLRIRPSHK